MKRVLLRAARSHKPYNIVYVDFIGAMFSHTPAWRKNKNPQFMQMKGVEICRYGKAWFSTALTGFSTAKVNNMQWIEPIWPELSSQLHH